MALMPFVNFYQALVPYIILAIALIIVDSRFGIEAAKKRGETIRQSRKWRRAINKLVDYICWISLAGVFSNAYSEVLGVPMLSAIVMLVVYAIEIVSCFNNYFESKGIDIRISFTCIFTHWFKKVSKSDVDIVEKKEE
jgi:L-lactate permease